MVSLKNILRFKFSSRESAPQIPSIEAPIRKEWSEAAAAHGRGQLKLGVQLWTEAMELQARLARQRGIDLSVRYLKEDWWCVAIGHIAHMEVLVKLIKLGWTDTKKFVVLAPNTTANDALFSYFEEYFEIIRDPKIVASIDTSLLLEYPAVIKVKQKWMFTPDAHAVVQDEWDRRKLSPLFTLKNDHEKSGRSMLEKWGMSLSDWFVAFHIRENGRVSGSELRDSTRNSTVENYFQLMRHIVEAGGWVVRIREPEYTPVPPMPRVVDYVIDRKSSEVEIFLFAKAKLVVCTNTGPAWIPNLFGTPVAYTNWAPTGIAAPRSKNRILTKRIRNLKTGRLLSIRAQNKEPVSQLESVSKLRKLGFEYEENTADQIKKFCI